MLSIPKLTQPEAKFVRTTEGLLIVIFNIAVISATIVSHIISGVHGLSVDDAAKWLGITNAITVLGRSGLKAVLSTQQGLGLPAPEQIFDPGALDDAEQLANSVIPEVEDVVAKAEHALDGPPETAAKPDSQPPAPINPAT